jgi:hypothetical protein
MPKPKRYPDNWQEIALSVKESALWRCAKCHQQCLRPGKQSGLTKSERCALTLTVHHRNRIPEDNRPENLIALCTACHLSYHNRGQSNVSPGQLSLFPDDAIDWDILSQIQHIPCICVHYIQYISRKNESLFDRVS